MRTLSFLLIFSLFFALFTGCSASDENETEIDTGDTTGEIHDGDTGSDTGSDTGEETPQQSKCGDMIVDEGEVCDGNTQECALIDPSYTGGTAFCQPNCSGWNAADCRRNGDPDDQNDSDVTPVSGFDKNSNGIWVDPATFLIWENPMGNPGVGGTGIAHGKALEYCENLVLAGADDWRLPSIDELRTLIRGVSTTMTGGKCPTSESCTDQDSCNKDKENAKGFGNSCLGCNALADTYDPAISYLQDSDCLISDRQIENGENYIVPAMFGDPARTWSATPNTGLAGSLTSAYWFVNFNAGYIGSDIASNGTHWVRCVRTGTAEDIPEHDAEAAHDPSWECIIDTDCPDGKWCEKHECVTKPAETYTAANGLEWQAGRVDKVASWEAAKTYCDALELAGKSDWRLPDIDELKSLSTCDKTAACAVTTECLSFTSCGGQQCKNNTCSSGHYIPAEVGQQGDSCWSSSEESVATSNAWLVNFANGSVFYISKTSSSFYARCVRGAMN